MFWTLPARRISSTSRPTKSTVGPKPSSRFSHHGAPVSSGWAFTTTPFVCRRCDSCLVSAKAGISVLNLLVACESWYVVGFLNVPWIAVPFEVIWLTLPPLTSLRKNGL